MILNVYDVEGNVTKTVEAENLDIEFGHIRSIMRLLDVDNINDTWALLKTVYSAWDKLTEVLSQVFPDMEDEDWEHVKIKELVPELLQIVHGDAHSVKVEQGVIEHRAVTCGQNEPIAVFPRKVCRVEFKEVLEQGVADWRAPHRQAGVAGFCLFNSFRG